MKRIVILLLASLTLLYANATDRLYIEDFSISAGETFTVNIMLDNETEYTAFQTDLYLPAGLTVEQEDGDFIFDLTSRKGRDHIITTQLQADGAIRIMSYSPTIKTYSGNSGALVTFNVTVTGESGSSATIELKNTLFTTKSGSEIAFNDETCNVTIILKQLTGDITFRSFGEEGDAVYYIGDNGDYTNEKSVEICYTGDEDVTLTIIVNGEIIIGEGAKNEDQLKNDRSSCCTLYLDYLPLPYDGINPDMNFSYYDITVIVRAKGYSDFNAYYNIKRVEPGHSYSYTTSMNIVTTDFRVVLDVESVMSNKILLLNGELVSGYQDDENDYEHMYYVIERTDESYYITVQAGSKMPMMDYFVMTSPETVFVPAINNRLEIQQCGPNGEISGEENNHYALIRYFGDSKYYNYYDEDEDDGIAMNHPSLFDIVINNHHIFSDTYDHSIDHSIHLVIDNDTIIVTEDNNMFSYGPISYRPNIDGFIIDLLPFGNDYGGNYAIYASVLVDDEYPYHWFQDYYWVEADAHFEYYVPIEAPTIVTQMTNDAVIVNMSSDLEYKKFIVDGEEVLELPYVAGRTNHDYYITVQAGHSPDSVRWAWTEEMTILIPAKDLPILRGDADGDGNVNISDVAALIDYLLSGNDALVPGKPDVDLNGAITIADVTTLIDYLLSDRWPGETSFTVNGVTFKLLDIAGGIFSMGATPEQEEGAHDNEKPVHEVALSPYSMSVTEVTQELWLAVMGTNPSRFSSNLNRPVENVSWNDCQVFIAKLNELTGQNFRLPTEAEWEFAARGGMNTQGYKYAGSNDLDEVAWYNYNAHAVGSSSPDYGTHAVATKAPNELGLYDMTGNVWEWCQDWSGTYSEAQQINPTGPETGTTRVMRGGGWTNYPSLLRIAARAGYKPTFKGNFTGLRLAL